MSANNIEEKLKHVISEHLGVDENVVVSTAKFADDLGADSLDALDLLMAVNEEFGTKIPAEDLEQIQTVEQMIDRVKKAA